MKFQITNYSKRSQNIISISEEKYDSISKAWQKILDAYFIEQKFMILLENYLELESDIYFNVINRESWADKSWSKGVDFIHHCNRRLLNFLTTSRVYFDQVPIHLSTFSSEENSLKHLFKTQANYHYDSSFSFRLLEALRNHAQHYNLPLDGTTINITKVKRDDDNVREHNLALVINVKSLIRNKDFKSRVKAEVQERYQFSSFDARPHIHDYISLIAEIHSRIRVEIDSLYAEAEAYIKGSIRQFCDMEVNKAHGFGLQKEKSPVIDIFMDPIKRREELILRHRELNIHEKVSVPFDTYDLTFVPMALDINS